jgi:hypothetical protein
MSDEDKDYQLKLLEAWSGLKFRVGNLVLIGNGVALTTSVAFLKESGSESRALEPLKLSTIGVVFGAIGILIAYAYANSYLTLKLDGRKATTGEKSHKQTKFAKTIRSFTAANVLFAVFIGLSAVCLSNSVAYLTGYTEGLVYCAAKKMKGDPCK